MNLNDYLQNVLNDTIEPSRVDYGSKLDAYAIVNVNDNNAQYGSRRLVQSEHNVQSFRQLFLFPATTSETAEKDLLRISAVADARKIQWNWPLTKEESGSLDNETGLTKRYLKDHIPVKLINNTISHIRLWDLCIQQNRPIVILNSNITFNFNFDWTRYVNDGFVNGVIGINSRNVETLNNDYLIDQMQGKEKGTLHKTPSLTFADLGINDPQPFMGHGAYVITPWAAKEGFKIIDRVGLWPIQFLLCRQLAPWTYITWPQIADAKGSISPTWSPPK